ncbi:assimilatory sulfite reductase (NADPH) flavoprotein subunit [Staphylococcus kloosii]|uniref:Sulfite reductase [NADPH] flavoprotein alpha-component n=1 Tax=Staphylococcus kloosii TaxID=29384 RepID=A0ABQ0XJL4_9STAP|nr:assimilatory sulfite reductase (NADPH) flavoprotein subunit [Staphylococcus kloosii]AVQ35122.1 assimilatory sulfite reductase (NADPH) flavoprotein subunit [Staphylococcus kloosii]MBF7030332.1 assimilatory sulfite reductase (NADPH) flavoprotein subunit [Staphylococcus kloosii]PNZ08219.1 assimilatory sulfite reductase (NADPH) flavoprotein subunit [Staphylococcus kloosii]PTJ79832.1 assimilatory sulfite reductase (NADPH) flavoprotein subunit [Staphylococcus kloosii]SUM48164.1 sulfite reductase 
MQFSVTNSPFNEEQAAQLNQLLQSLTPEQRLWLSGYLAANQQASTTSDNTQQIQQVPEAAPSAEAVKPRDITVLYGSETGNAQSLAELLDQRLTENGYTVTLSSMDAFKTKDLKKVEDLFIVSATHGEGDPPDNAITFHEFLHSRKAPKLEGVRYSVLALGDESYEFFCQTGKDFDARLAELGGERLTHRVDCDLDFDEPAENWMQNVLEALSGPNDNRATVAETTETVQSAKEKKYSKSNPYEAEVLENINLTGRGSNKEVRHVELLLDNYGEGFEPGDCLAIIPENDPVIVTQLISLLGWDPELTVEIDNKGNTASLTEAFTEHFEITKLTIPLVKKLAELVDDESLNAKLAEDGWVQTYVEGRDLIDFFKAYNASNIQPSDLLEALRKLPAREYSIASSYKANPDEVHITVGAVRYNAHDRDREGVCSIQLAERVQPGDTVKMYLKKNPNFKFPFEEDKKVIMIGPGTGVAPFRSYLEEREELDLKGNTWLFFGEQHFTTDFLYQTDWQTWLNDGILSKLDVAFSRDTDEKVYVQHRIEENSELFFQWLEEGAAIYVCGDEKYMAKDVNEAILRVIAKEGNMSEADAEAYLNQMKTEKRYQRDIY